MVFPSEGRTHEIDADGGDVALSIRIIGEPQQQARLANSGVTNEQELEEVVVSVIATVRTEGFRDPAGGAIARLKLYEERIC